MSDQEKILDKWREIIAAKPLIKADFETKPCSCESKYHQKNEGFVDHRDWFKCLKCGNLWA